MASLELEKIHKYFGKIEAVKGVDISIKDGEFLTFVGPSGCGKSTTLRIIAGLEELTEGNLKINGKISNDLPSKKRNMAMVFQSYALFPQMTVESNILFGLKIRKKSTNFKQEKLDWVISLMGLQGLGKRLPGELSGGQRQRVALARALVLDSDILLLDEPLSNLDAKLRLKMRTELKKIHKQLNYTIIYVTHDQTEAMTLSDRIAVMHKGKLIQCGTPGEVYNFPKNLFVAGFIGSPVMNFIKGEIIRERNSLYFKKNNLSLKILPHLADKLSGKIRDIILGIRPEDIYIKQNISKDKMKFKSYNSRVVVVEPMGSVDIICINTLDDESLELTMLTSPETNIRPDMNLEIIFNLKKIHLFDPITNNSLLTGAASAAPGLRG